MRETIRPDFVTGRIRLFLADQRGREIRSLHETPNLYLYGGADIACALVSGLPFRIATMYMEFENLASPTDPIVPPTYDRTGGIGYYTSLAAPRDFLRIPITIQPTRQSSDPALYQGNRVSFFALTAGTIGQHGLPFSDTVNSAVFGAALCASPDPATQANDVVWSRAYFADRYELKQPNHQIGIEWSLQFA